MFFILGGGEMREVSGLESGSRTRLFGGEKINSDQVKSRLALYLFFFCLGLHKMASF